LEWNCEKLLKREKEREKKEKREEKPCELLTGKNLMPRRTRY
jgi:hypothetical protein